MSQSVTCVINLVNLQPMERVLTSVQAQIRPCIRERCRVDLFQSPLIALSNSLSVFHARPLPPLLLCTRYLLIPPHSPEESSLCAGAGRQTEAQRWIWLRVTWFCLSAWPLSKYRGSALLSLCLHGGSLGLPPLLLRYGTLAEIPISPWARTEFVNSRPLSG